MNEAVNINEQLEKQNEEFRVRVEGLTRELAKQNAEWQASYDQLAEENSRLASEASQAAK